MQQGNPYAPPGANALTAPQQIGIKQLLFSFQGRIPRRHYWGAALATIGVFYAVIFAIAFGIGLVVGGDSAAAASGIIVIVFYIPVLWIMLALQVKRWHDRGKPGMWVLINLIPIVGGIWSFIEVGCLRGTVGTNQFGPDPT